MVYGNNFYLNSNTEYAYLLQRNENLSMRDSLKVPWRSQEEVSQGPQHDLYTYVCEELRLLLHTLGKQQYTCMYYFQYVIIHHLFVPPSRQKCFQQTCTRAFILTCHSNKLRLHDQTRRGCSTCSHCLTSSCSHGPATASSRNSAGQHACGDSLSHNCGDYSCCNNCGH